MEKFNFKKGDKVPQFVERYDEKNVKGHFLTDVLVLKHDYGTEVYPTESMEDTYRGIMNFDSIVENGYVRIMGLPTKIFNHPYGSPKNESNFGISY